VLNEVAPACAVRPRVGQQPAHHVELVIAWKDLRAPLSLRSLVPFLSDLRVVFEDVGKAVLGQDLFPEVVRRQAFRVGRVARTVLMPLIERQKPTGGTLEVGAHPDLMVVYGKVYRAAAELKEELFRVPVVLVLIDGIVNGLFGQPVFQFEGGNGKSVDEKAEIQGEPRFIGAVAKLPGDAEKVFGV